MSMLKTEAIKNYLLMYTREDLAALYSSEMECQVNVKQGQGQPVDGEYKGKRWMGYTDGITTWKPFRIPFNANTEATYEDRPITFNLALHCDGIGMTGWNWKRKVSQWVAFDFDALVGHSEKHAKKLSAEELQAVADSVRDVSWVTLRKSTSGRGLHLYVMLDDVPTANHNEHAALARAVLSKLSGLVGYELDAKVDTCVTKDTWTMTADGPRQISELINVPHKIVVDGANYETKGFYSTGVKEVFNIQTREGYSVQATDNHLFLTDRGIWKSVKDICEGDGLILQTHKDVVWEGAGTWNTGYILGSIFGDGNFCSRDTHHRLLFHKPDHDNIEFVEGLFTQPVRRLYDDKRECYELCSTELEDLRQEFGLDCTKQVTTFIEEASSNFARGFLSAFFDCDSSVEKDGSRITLHQSDLGRLKAVQRMLLRFGIFSRVTLCKKAGDYNIQGKRGKSKAAYILRISQENVTIFNQRVGFCNKIKKERSEQNACTKNLNRVAHVKIKTSIGLQEVFDVKVPKIHAFDANGFMAHNCGGNFWVYHSKMIGTDGLTLIKSGEKLKDIPENWKDNVRVITRKSRRVTPTQVVESGTREEDFNELVDQRPRTPLDPDHKRLIKYLEDNKCRWWWDTDNHMLITHTFHLKEAHNALRLCGPFETVSTGKEAGNDHNCFAFPLRGGAWAVRRYGPRTQESATWVTDAKGWTKCYYNKTPDIATVARLYSAIETDKGSFIFSDSKRGQEAVKYLGIDVIIPVWAVHRKLTLKELVGKNKVVISMEHVESDPTGDMAGWLLEKKLWKRVFNYQPGSRAVDLSETENHDERVRHVVTTGGVDAGWMLKVGDTWRDESLVHIRLALNDLDLGVKDINTILGEAVNSGWVLVNMPFEPEYPGDRKWNKNRVQFRFPPKQDLDSLTYPTWQMIADHCGRSLTPAILEHEWCQKNMIKTGGEYLILWLASLVQSPKKPLPYLFFWGEQNSGKSFFHEAFTEFIIVGGHMTANSALVSSANFNAELENKILCIVEEVDLRKNNSEAYNRMKQWVTAPEITIHPKGMTPYLVPNYTHYIQTGNSRAYCPVFAGDTRITISHVDKPDRVIPKEQLRKQLEKEAPDFLAHLLRIELPESDDRLALPVIMTEDKEQAEIATMDSLEQFIYEEKLYKKGHKVLASDFIAAFHDWLSPEEVGMWSRNRIGRRLNEIDPHKFPRGRTTGNINVHYGNLSLDKEAQHLPVILKSSKHYLISIPERQPDVKAQSGGIGAQEVRG